MDKFKLIMITAGVCFVIAVVIFFIQYFSFKAELKQRERIAFMRGKAEVTINENKELLKEIEKSLKLFDKKINEYSDTIKKSKEAWKNVKTGLENINTTFYNLNRDFNRIYELWAGAGN